MSTPTPEYDVLIGCEFSGVVRDAFIARGYRAISCDLEPSERPGPHYQGDIRDMLTYPFKLAVFFPPCQYLAVSGARWWYARQYEQHLALEFVRMLLSCAIPHLAIENPVGAISTHIRPPDQYIQPWQFGHGETKRTGLWLENTPHLVPSNIVDGRIPRVHHEPPSPHRSKNRSRTYSGIADAMAAQWGECIHE